VKLAGNLPLVFQAFGCPAAAVSGSSDSFQATWFGRAITHAQQVEQVRALFVFEFLDWSPKLFELAYGDVLSELSTLVGADFVDRFERWLLTTGLVRRSDATARPALAIFVEAASRR
jgi:hypothetical protein